MEKLLTLILAAVLAASCVANGLLSDGADALDGDPWVEHGMIVLGDRLEDPYTVENMTQALSVLYPTKADRIILQTTDYYVRFLPANAEQLKILEELGVEMLDHPVDYEIVREGDWYHDPEVPEGEITWQYAVVKTDFVFPRGIRYEILDRCHIPETGASTKADGIDWEAVEREAYRLTGNEALLEGATKGEESGTPAGRITIQDPARSEPEGVRGVRVGCNRFVKFAHAYTDEDGYYRMDKKFSSAPRFRLVFKNSAGFAIGFNLVLCPASFATLGRGTVQGMDLEVTPDSDERLYARCVVNNAGYDYYKRCAALSPALKTPPKNLRIWLFQRLSRSSTIMMQQGVMVDNSKLGEYLGEFSVLLKMFLPDITLGLGDSDDYAGIYANAMHELAHASHFMLCGRNFWESYVRFILTSFVSSGFVTYGVGTEEDHGYCEVGDMWAYFLESVLYRERYGGDRSFGLSYWFHPQIFLQLSDRGLPAEKIFQVLSEDVTDRAVLQKKLTSYYPECKSAISQAFARYN